MNDENPETKTPAAPERSEADAAAAREAFFAKVPDPPEKDVVAAQSADAGDDEPEAAKADPKAKAEKKPPVDAASDQLPVADRIVAALKAGDLDTLADLTDQDPAAFDEKSTKWAARNRKDAKRKEEIEKVRADAKAIVDHYEPIDTRLEAFQKTRDYAIVAELVELLTGEDFDSVGMKVFRARKGVDPRVPELTKKLQEREAEVADLRTTKEKASDRALREALRDDLPEDHVVRKLPDWEDRVARVLRESVDDTGEPALSFKQAANRVVRKEREEYEKRASVFGEVARPAKQRAATPERSAPASGAGQRKLTRDEFFASYGK
jgi:hypothetical protein